MNINRKRITLNIAVKSYVLASELYHSLVHPRTQNYFSSADIKRSTPVEIINMTAIKIRRSSDGYTIFLTDSYQAF